MKFKFIHKISVIQEKFLVFFNLLRGQDKTLSGAGSGPQAAGCASLIQMLEDILLNLFTIVVLNNGFSRHLCFYPNLSK